jgi:hypothetical protein
MRRSWKVSLSRILRDILGAPSCCWIAPGCSSAVYFRLVTLCPVFQRPQGIVGSKFDLYFNVINLADQKAPLNAGNYAAVNYNPTYTQIGAVGRTIRIGANFQF